MLLMPVVVLFFQDIGLTLTQVFFTQTVFAIVSVVLEVPSGYFADRYGMRYSLIIGTITAWLGMSAYALAFDFYTVLAAEVLLGISTAFISGSDSALLYETVHALNRSIEYKSRESALLAFSTGAEGIAGILGGIFALLSLRTPAIGHAILIFCAIPLTWSLYEPRELQKHRTILASGSALTTMWRTFVQTLHTHKTLKWLVLYGAIIDASGLVLVWFRQPYFELAQLPLAWFGVVWALCLFATTCAALYASHYERVLGKKWGLVGFIVLTVLVYITLGMGVSLALIALVVLHGVIRGFKEPLMREYVQALADSSVRATILSINGFVARGLFAIAGPFFGYMADVYTLQTALLAAGIIFGVLGAVALVQLARHKAFVV